MSLYSLVYVSVATKPFSDTDLRKLLDNARQRNHTLNVTGMLLYRDGFFIQDLEGEKDIVEDLFAHISKDSRHKNVLVVFRDTIKQRTFGEWSMGFNKIDNSTIDQMPGFTDFLDAPDEKYDFILKQPTRVAHLLDSFKHHTYF